MNPLDMFYQGHLANMNNYPYPSSIFHFDEAKNEATMPIHEPREVSRPLSELTTVGVNHIVAAHFIKSLQIGKSANSAKVPSSTSSNNVAPSNTLAAEVNRRMGDLTQDHFSQDVNDFTNIQLNTVSDMMKKLKENKMSEIVQSDKNEKKES